MALDVELLEQSFELVKPKADDFVASFYNNLFTDYPDAKPLFEHTNMAAQQQMLKGALVMVVDNLRRPEVLSKSLKGLGARHIKYGALPEHYPLVGNSLIKTLEQYAGPAWNSKLESAWAGAYSAITELMLEGASYEAAAIALESDAPTGSSSPTTSAAAPTEDPPSEQASEKASEGGLKVEVLEQSFELIKPRADEFTASFYENLLTDYPAARPLFEHTSMPKQRHMLKGALVMVVDNLRKPEVLSEALRGLGARHVKYGALPEHYPLVGSSLLKTLEQYAGPAWTAEVKDAWVGAYGAITEIMLDGADYSKSDIRLSDPTVGTTTSSEPSVASSAVSTESPEGISNGKAAGIIGSGAVALAVLMLILL
ncbi:Globin domain protein [Synechococcus sp. PCC 7335]|uniref:globin family protein n=1 Tax=Synechococcus sp. (strain ATCC 29403 / PCC 7335) TaxID=91464 RepID=UPI00017EBC45|nr:globin family protein [Synechococcus sp. PCC 7335]EDX84356.1 Globin domain protein [Synechococcus sp. PCC 7335]